MNYVIWIAAVLLLLSNRGHAATEQERFCNFSKSSYSIVEDIRNLTFSVLENQDCVTPPAGYVVYVEGLSNIAPTTAELAYDDGENSSSTSPTPVRYIFDNVSFSGLYSQLMFLGLKTDSTNTKLLDAIMMNLPVEYGEQMEETVTFNALSEFFSDEKNFRKPNSKLRYDPETRKNFSRYIKSQIDSFLPRPLMLSLNNCRFTGGASFRIQDVLPVGSTISVTNSEFSATYMDMFLHQIYTSTYEFVDSRAFFNFFSVELFGGEINFENISLSFHRSPPTSPQSLFFVDPYRAAIRTEISLFQVIQTFCFHSSVVSVSNVIMNVEGVAIDQAAYFHPNVSILNDFVTAYNVSAYVLPKLLVENSIPTVSVLSSSFYLFLAIVTEWSEVRFTNIIIEMDGQSVFVPATDEMWLKENSSDPVLNAPGTVSLKDLRTTNPSAFPTGCYVLEIPMVVQSRVVMLHGDPFELSQHSTWTINNPIATAVGHQPRGGGALSYEEAITKGYGDGYVLNLTEMKPANIKSVVEDILATFNRTFDLLNTSTTADGSLKQCSILVNNISLALVAFDTSQSSPALQVLREIITTYYIQSLGVNVTGVIPTMLVSIFSMYYRSYANASSGLEITGAHITVSGLFLIARVSNFEYSTLEHDAYITVSNSAITLTQAVVSALINVKTFTVYPIQVIAAAASISAVELVASALAGPNSLLTIDNFTVDVDIRNLGAIKFVCAALQISTSLQVASSTEVVVQNVNFQVKSVVDLRRPSTVTYTEACIVYASGILDFVGSQFNVRHSLVNVTNHAGIVSAIRVADLVSKFRVSLGAQVICTHLTFLQRTPSLPSTADSSYVSVAAFDAAATISNSSQFVISHVVVRGDSLCSIGVQYTQPSVLQVQTYPLTVASGSRVQIHDIDIDYKSSAFQTVQSIFSVSSSATLSADSSIDIFNSVVRYAPFRSARGLFTHLTAIVIIRTAAELTISTAGTTNGSMTARLSITNVSMFVTSADNSTSWSRIGLFLSDKLSVVNVNGGGAQISISKSNLEVVPFDASDEQRAYMLQHWSWKYFQQYPDNTLASNSTFGAMNAPAGILCGVLVLWYKVNVQNGGSVQLMDTTAKIFSAVRSINPNGGYVAALIFDEAQWARFYTPKSLVIKNLTLTIFTSYIGGGSAPESFWIPTPTPLGLGMIFIDKNSVELCDVTVNGANVPMADLTPLFYPWPGSPITWWKNPNITRTTTITTSTLGTPSPTTTEFNQTMIANTTSTEVPTNSSSWESDSNLTDSNGSSVDANITTSQPTTLSTTSTTSTTMPQPTTTTAPSTQIFSQSWFMRGLSMYYFSFAKNAANGANSTLNNRFLIDQSLVTCDATDTHSIDKSASVSPTISVIKPRIRTETASFGITDSESRNVTASWIQRKTSSEVASPTQTTAASKSRSISIATKSQSISNSEPCNESVIEEIGSYWRTHVLSNQLDTSSDWWKHVLESNVIDGLSFRFRSGVSMPPNISGVVHAADDALKARAIMYAAAATPADRALNFHGIRGASSPSYPYLVATVTNGYDLLFEMNPLPKFEIYASEWWDIYLPASFVVPGPCASKLAENAAYKAMWGAIVPGPEVTFVANDGLNPKENVYVYYTTLVIDPNVDKPLAKFAEGFAAAANGISIAAGLISSTIIASAAPQVQAIGIFAHMEACNSPQISAFFGSPWVLSPVYFYEVFGTDEKAKMAGILAGNFLFIIVVLIVQLIIVFACKVCCPPFASDMTVFGLARFPSVTLSVLFGIHGGSVFASSRLLRLVDKSADDDTKYLAVGILGVIFYAVVPCALYLSAWWCIPRTFQVYDLQHRSVTKTLTPNWLSKLMPVGAIFPRSTRQSTGIFISSFRRSSHFWVTTPLWVSTISGIVGFADLTNVDDSYGACFVWGIILGVLFLAMAVLFVWRMPKRHFILTIIDALALLALAVLYGFTVPWRQIVYPPQERFSEGEAGKINWPDLAVVILSFIIIGLVVLHAIFSLIVCNVERIVQAIDPPTYIIWSHKSGGQIRAERVSTMHRLEDDKATLQEMLLQATAHEAALPVLPIQASPSIFHKSHSASSAPVKRADDSDDDQKQEMDEFHTEFTIIDDEFIDFVTGTEREAKTVASTSKENKNNNNNNNRSTRPAQEQLPLAPTTTKSEEELNTAKSKKRRVKVQEPKADDSADDFLLDDFSVL